MTIINKLATTLNDALLLDRPFESETTRINLERINIIVYVAALLHVAHIIIFWADLAGNGLNAVDTDYRWRTAIIFTHTIALFVSLAAGFATSAIRKNNLGQALTGRAIPIAVAIVYLLFGAAICIIDQMVVASINAYLITSVAVALVVIMHPGHAAPLYGLVYLLYYFALPVTQADSELLLTMRVNGFSVTVIGFGLSLITWRTNMVAILQNKLIEKQKEELEKKNAQLQHMVRTDMLTGLYNQKRFIEFVEMEIARIKRTGEESCLIFMDLDYFKKVNDLYGHPNGDVVLKWIAGVIRGHLRSTDLAARFGGEEFAILLPGTPLDGACRAAEKIRRAIEGCTFMGEMEDLQVTASFGVTSLSKSGAESFNTAYRAADRALYRAKENGRNRVECSG